MKPPIPVVVDVGELVSREDVERFVMLLCEREARVEAERRGSLLAKVKNMRTREVQP